MRSPAATNTLFFLLARSPLTSVAMCSAPPAGMAIFLFASFGSAMEMPPNGGLRLPWKSLIARMVMATRALGTEDGIGAWRWRCSPISAASTMMVPAKAARRRHCRGHMTEGSRSSARTDIASPEQHRNAHRSPPRWVNAMDASLARTCDQCRTPPAALPGTCGPKYTFHIHVKPMKEELYGTALFARSFQGCARGHAQAQKGYAEERQKRQDRQEPQAGHRHRSLGGAQKRQEGAKTPIGAVLRLASAALDG